MALLFIIIIPLIAFLVTLLSRKNLSLISLTTVIASILELLAVGMIFEGVLKHGTYLLNGYFSVDPLGLIILTLVALVGSASSCYSVAYLKNEMKKNIIGFSRLRQYFILLHLFILAMFFAIMTTSPIFMWVAIEATTLSTAFLISFYNKPEAIEAAWKYLIINSVGLLLAFFGTILFLYQLPKGGFEGIVSWQALLTNINSADPFIIKTAFVFILIGFGTKVGLAPMHTWLPDAHSKAPAPISSLLSGVLLNVAFLAVLRFKLLSDLAVGKEFSSSLFIILGTLSITVAAFLIYTQKNYKRLLAYSSIEHMGIAALGFGFGGIGAYAALLHMIYHSLTKSALFLSAGNLLLKFGSTKISKIKGALSVLPITGVLFIIGFLSITGVPPFGTFITEFTILAVGIKENLAVVIIVLIALALIFVGFLRHVSSMFFGIKEDSIKTGENGWGTLLPIIALVAILVSLSIFLPSEIRSLLISSTNNY